MTKKERKELARQLAAGHTTGYGLAVAENDAEEQRIAELETRTAEPSAQDVDLVAVTEEPGSGDGTGIHGSLSIDNSTENAVLDTLEIANSAVLENIIAVHETQQSAPETSAEIVEIPLTDADIAAIEAAAGVTESEPSDVKPDTTETPFGDALNNEQPEATAPPVPTTDVLLAKVLELQKTLESLRGSQKPRKQRVASGSKPRPNVHYVILDTGVQWSGTPQVGQLINILASAPAKELDEPELVKLIEAGHSKGLLRTKQEPFRIFQYYRDTLKEAGVVSYS